ncbi:MAG TPA: AAA family ATPase [Thermoleophilaceae bacterium]
MLLERESELRDLEREIGEACAGRGRVVLVEGEPGIGKTRLLEVVRERSREHGMTVLSARASELDRDFPLGVVRQLFEPLLAGADAATRRALLHGAAAAAAPLLGLAAPEPGGAPAADDPSLPHFHALYWLAANLTERGPAALVIDDLHWADASSLRFLQFLLPRLDELPVLVALAARPDEAGSDRRSIDALATDARAVVLRPPPLSEDAVPALVAARLGPDPDRAFCDACRAATGGNPFLLRELLRELAADGVAPAAAAAPLVRQLAPPTVGRAVLLRVARLGPDAAALARAVAVLGDGAPLRRAAALAELGEDLAAAAAEHLAGAGILAAARPLAFAHPILRSAVYADIAAGERADAHRHAAEVLAAEGAGADAVAVHLLATEPAAEPRVVATLREAARDALARGAAPAAAACLRRALAEPPATDDRAALTLELASAELHAGEPVAAAEHFEEGARLAGDPRVRASCAVEWSAALQAAGRHQESYAVRERAIEDVADADPELALLLETTLIATASLDLARLEWARARLRRHDAAAEPATPAGWRLIATQAYVDAMYGDSPAATLAAAAERALGAREPAGAPSGFAGTPFFTAVEVLALADANGPAREALDQAVADARRQGSALAFACSSGWRCMLLARLGELAEAEADARSCAELSLAQGWFALAPPMLGYVLDVLIARGELDDAERILIEAGAAERAAGDDLTFYPVIHARARLRAARGDTGGAHRDMTELARRRARWNTDLTLVPPLLAAPELAHDDADAARSETAAMLGEARAWGTPRAIGMALRASGLAEGGTRGVELLEEAAAVLGESPARLEHARALADLGAALRRANRRSAAREPLRRALDLADACGAGPLAERARQELRAAGGRPRRPRISGVGALTASERRIAAMAAEGLSNPEIAQALFVTKKTVETHLGNAYRKLGIRSRGALGAALGGSERED